jgi:membrane-associated protease RseP (regulator of RpoE activity)
MTPRARLATGFLAGTLVVGALLAWPNSLLPVQSRQSPIIPGITVERIKSAQGAATIVTSLQTNGIASHAGLRVGDRIDALDGLRPASFVGDGGQHAPPHDIRVWRDGRIFEIRIAQTSGG